MKVYDRDVDKSPNYGDTQVPLYIVMHATAGGFQSAYNWLRNPSAKRLVNGVWVDARVSAQWLIDKTGDSYNLVPEHLQAWHAGISRWEGRPYLNGFSVGYELVNDNTGNDPYPAEQYLAALELVAASCKRWHIPATRNKIVAHYEISPGRKNDPRAFPMDKFVKDVYALVNRAPAPAPQPFTQYVVTPSNGLKIRTAPNTKAKTKVVATLPRGEVVTVDKILTRDNKPDCEEVVTGDSRWAHLADGRGFVYFRYLNPVG